MTTILLQSSLGSFRNFDAKHGWVAYCSTKQSLHVAQMHSPSPPSLHSVSMVFGAWAMNHIRDTIWFWTSDRLQETLDNLAKRAIFDYCVLSINSVDNLCGDAFIKNHSVELRERVFAIVPNIAVCYEPWFFKIYFQCVDSYLEEITNKWFDAD